MKTDHLIRLAAADARVDAPFGRALPLWFAGVLACLAAMFLGTLGLRPDFATAIAQPATQIKQVFPWALAAGGLLAAMRLSQPGRRPGLSLAVMALAPLLVAVALGREIASDSTAIWSAAMRDPRRFSCLAAIPTLAAPLVAFLFWRLRAGAPTRPGLTAAVAGLAGGGGAAGLYAFHCDNDSPAFFGIWYGVAIALVTLVAFLVGRRLLRW